MRNRDQWVLALILALLALVAGPALAQEPADEPAAAAGEPIAEPAAEPPAEPEPAAEPATQEPAGVATTLSETPGAMVDAVGGAVTEATEAARAGGAGAMEQGRRLWSDALAPMLQRMAAGIPIILKALLLLR
jgi:hypothetical protein